MRTAGGVSGSRAERKQNAGAATKKPKARRAKPLSRFDLLGHEMRELRGLIERNTRTIEKFLATVERLLREKETLANAVGCRVPAPAGPMPASTSTAIADPFSGTPTRLKP